MPIQIVNIDKVDWDNDNYGNFSYSRKHLTPLVNAEMLGASIYKLMPNSKAFPYHFHYANEEAILILEGNGTLRLNDEKISVTKGDYFALGKGPDNAHQMINSSSEPLIYLCFSTMIHPDVVEYPDSNKIGISAGTAPGGNKTKSYLKKYFLKNSDVDYSEGE